ncbi:MAG: hypothetical protein ACJ79E_03210 [Anaeromyxobacteraceae bacterium]
MAVLLLQPVLALPSEGAPGADATGTGPGLAIEHGKAATADASPVEPGALEVEIGYAPVWNDRGGSRGFLASRAAHTHAFTTALTYGVRPDVDVKVVGGFATIFDSAHLHADGSRPRRGQGLVDAVLGARWRVLNLAEQGLEVALTGEAVAPTGAAHLADQVGLTQGYWTARGALVATKDLGRLSMNGELSALMPVSGDTGGLRSVLQVNTAMGYQVLPWLQPELELNYASEIGMHAQVLSATAGIVAPFGAGHRIVAALQHGLWGRNATETTSALLAYKTAF